MKNIIVVDIDSDRAEKQVIIGKVFPPPENMTIEQYKEYLANDITTMLEAIITMLKTTDHHEQIDSNQLLRDCIKYIEHGYFRASDDPKVKFKIV